MIDLIKGAARGLVAAGTVLSLAGMLSSTPPAQAFIQGSNLLAFGTLAGAAISVQKGHVHRQQARLSFAIA